MERDLADLLAAFFGGPTEESRRSTLLERLRADPDFRRAFAAELAMVGRLRAVQSPEPRWLALEDEIGRGRIGEEDLELRVREAAEREFRRRRLRRRTGLAAAALLATAGAAILILPRHAPSRPSLLAPVAVAVHLEEVQWEEGGMLQPRSGQTLPPGRLRLRSGRLSLAFLNGVVATLQGPADAELVSLDRMLCRQGSLRLRVPRGAEGFSVLAPGCAVVDLGTDLALHVPSQGPPRVTVLEGKAELSILRADGSTLRSLQLEGRATAEIDPATGRIQTTGPTASPSLLQPPLPDPPLTPDYAAMVKADRPWGYWRFTDTAAGEEPVPGEIAGTPPLRPVGPLARAGGTAVFERGKADAYLVLDGLWTPFRRRGYAVEVWFLSESYDRATLVSLSPPPETTGAEVHCLLMELTARSRDLFHAPGAIRFLHRWPPGASGGTNVFSRTIYRPYRWTHVLAQRRPDRMELYLDGELAGTVPLDPEEDIAPCRVFFGRLVEHPRPELGQIRPFKGRLAEPALYDRPLDPAEIRRHARGGSPR